LERWLLPTCVYFLNFLYNIEESALTT